MLDKIALANESKNAVGDADDAVPLAVPYDAAARSIYDADPNNQSVSFDEFKSKIRSRDGGDGIGKEETERRGRSIKY